MRIFILGICSLILNEALLGQRVIAVQNPSFQRDLLWYSCNFMKYREQEPKSDSNYNAVTTLASRSGAIQDNESNQLANVVDYTDIAFEGISQKLTKPLARNHTYQLNFNGSRDTIYSLDNQALPFTQKPMRLYIFGAMANCGYGELLAPPYKVNTHFWTKYHVNLRASKEWTHMVIYAVHDDDSMKVDRNNQSFLMMKQQGPLKSTSSRAARPTKAQEALFNSTKSFSKLSYGGILMMYEASPRAINLFDDKGEILQVGPLRKDMDHNPSLDSILNRFRGIDYVFLIKNEKKYRAKRLNILSYLKTKYPFILPFSKVMRYSTLASNRKMRSNFKNVNFKKEEAGDLLVMEQVNSFQK